MVGGSINGKRRIDAFTGLSNILKENNIDDVWIINSYIKKGRKISGMKEFSYLSSKLHSVGYKIEGGLLLMTIIKVIESML